MLVGCWKSMIHKVRYCSRDYAYAPCCAYYFFQARKSSTERPQTLVYSLCFAQSCHSVTGRTEIVVLVKHVNPLLRGALKSYSLSVMVWLHLMPPLHRGACQGVGKRLKVALFLALPWEVDIPWRSGLARCTWHDRCSWTSSLDLHGKMEVLLPPSQRSGRLGPTCEGTSPFPKTALTIIFVFQKRRAVHFPNCLCFALIKIIHVRATRWCRRFCKHMMGCMQLV